MRPSPTGLDCAKKTTDAPLDTVFLGRTTIAVQKSLLVTGISEFAGCSRQLIGLGLRRQASEEPGGREEKGRKYA